MKKYSLVALLLALCLCAGLLSGCGSQAAASAAAPETAASEEAATEAAGETAEAPADAPADNAAEEADSALEEEPVEEIPEWEYEPIEYPIADGNVTLDYWITWELSPNTIYDDISEHICLKELADATGVNLNVLAQSQAAGDTNTNLMLASGDYPDMIGGFKYTTGMDAAIEDDIVVDIKDDIAEFCPDYYKYLMEDDSKYWQAVQTDEGHIGAFVTVGTVAEVADGTMTYTYMMDELGFAADKINTVDAYAEYLTAAKNKYGMAAPLYMPGDFVFANDVLASAYGVSLKIDPMTGDLPWFVEDGVVKSGYLQEGYKEYVTLLHDWFEQGLLDSDTASHVVVDKNDDLIGLIANKQVAIFHQHDGLIDLFANLSGEEVVAIPLPTVHEGDQLHIGGAREAISGESGVVITTDCDEYELAMEFMNYCYTDEWALASNYGVEGTTYDMVDGEPVFQDWTWQGSASGGNFSSTMMDYTFLAQVDMNVDTPGMSKAAMECKDIWNANIDNQNDYPDAAAMTADENSEYNNYAGDVITLIQTSTAKFITGDQPLDEVEAFQQQLIDTGIEECAAQKQAAYDRYMSRD